jgi:hypothetical protein
LGKPAKCSDCDQAFAKGEKVKVTNYIARRADKCPGIEPALARAKEISPAVIGEAREKKHP